MLGRLARIGGGGFPFHSRFGIEQFDDEEIEKVHSMGLDGSSNALLSVHSRCYRIVDSTQFVGSLALHFRHGNESGKIRSDQFSFVFVVFS